MAKIQNNDHIDCFLTDDTLTIIRVFFDSEEEMTRLLTSTIMFLKVEDIFVGINPPIYFPTFDVIIKKENLEKAKTFIEAL